MHSSNKPPEDLLSNWGVWALSERFCKDDEVSEIKCYTEREKNIDELGILKWKIKMSPNGLGENLSNKELKRVQDFEKMVCVIDWTNLEDYKNKWSTNIEQYKEQIKKKAIDKYIPSH